jgi:hypothetical protein
VLPAIVTESGEIMTALLTSVAVIALFMVPVAWLVYSEIVDSGSR